MNKKKLLTLAMTLAMVAILAIGGTIAYFTDTDNAQNVMTLGEVDIEQNEYQRDEEGNWEDFEDNKPLMPIVDTREDKKQDPVVDGWFDDAINNVVDKIITVENVADGANLDNKEAYVRTLIAFEGRCDVQDVYIGKIWSPSSIWERNWVRKTVNGELISNEVEDANGNTVLQAREVVIDGVVHTVIECIYVGTEFGDAGVLPAGEETDPSLKQVFMAYTANNEIVELFGDEYTIYAVTQATQTAGFDNAEIALDTAFGDPELVDDATFFAWFEAAFPAA